MKMGYKVKKFTKEQKENILKDFLNNTYGTKVSLAKKYNTSPRTIGRVIKEMSTEEVFDYDYTVTKNQISIFKGEECRSVTRGYPKFKSIKEKLFENDFSDEILKESYEILNLPKFIETFSEGNITVNHEEGKIYYGTFEIKNSLSKHLMMKLEEGEDVKSFVKFIDKVMGNPKKDIVEELYGFMVHNGIGIDEDGDIISYKGVTPDYLDCWTETISHKVGECPTMPFSEVEHNPDKPCGKGLHSGSLEYAKAWAGNGHVMIIKQDPSKVGSVPWDASCQKMRGCGYQVIGEVY